MNHQDRIQLTNKIRRCFNEEGLRELCFQLNIEYDDLAGSNRSGKARELVLLCEQNGRLHDLVVVCEKMRPNETWPKTEDMSLIYHPNHQRSRLLDRTKCPGIFAFPDGGGC